VKYADTWERTHLLFGTHCALALVVNPNHLHIEILRFTVEAGPRGELSVVNRLEEHRGIVVALVPPSDGSAGPGRLRLHKPDGERGTAVGCVLRCQERVDQSDKLVVNAVNRTKPRRVHQQRRREVSDPTPTGLSPPLKIVDSGGIAARDEKVWVVIVGKRSIYPGLDTLVPVGRRHPRWIRVLIDRRIEVVSWLGAGDVSSGCRCRRDRLSQHANALVRGHARARGAANRCPRVHKNRPTCEQASIPPKPHRATGHFLDQSDHDRICSTGHTVAITPSQPSSPRMVNANKHPRGRRVSCVLCWPVARY
jgi:hypothetical protein